ncbi:hypothetical protein D3C87_1024800 [compost metagenome]
MQTHPMKLDEKVRFMRLSGCARRLRSRKRASASARPGWPLIRAVDVKGVGISSDAAPFEGDTAGFNRAHPPQAHYIGYAP